MSMDVVLESLREKELLCIKQEEEGDESARNKNTLYYAPNLGLIYLQVFEKNLTCKFFLKY